jgi:hypothetical protein
MPVMAHELKLYVGELRQLFDSLDPAPFRERDIDPQAAEYIVDSAREFPAGAPLALQVQLGREAVTEANEGMLREAFREYFERRAASKHRELRQLFRNGRRALAIGLVFLAGAVGLAQWLGGVISHEGYAWLASESLIIGGWVALWRPMEIFLYEWWPLRADARLFRRLAGMPVTLRGADAAAGSPA